MSDVKIMVGGAIEEAVAHRFVDAWHRAEGGEPSVSAIWLGALSRVLTGKRMELLHYVHRHNVTSVRALAKALGRDCSNVHADVQAPTPAGLLDAADRGLRADYDAIETTIAI